MVKGGKVSHRQNFKKRVGSDDSDEDYVISDEDNEVSDNDSEDYCLSLDSDASDDNFNSYAEDENEEEKEAVKKVVKSKSKNSSSRGKVECQTSQKRTRVSYIQEEDGDEDYNDEDDTSDDDDEFTLDEDDAFEEEDELWVEEEIKKDHIIGRKRGRPKKGSAKNLKKRKRSRVSKKPPQRNYGNNRGLRKSKVSCDDDEEAVHFIANELDAREKTKKSLVCRRKRFVAQSDSDFEYPETSDREYTMSEEEREQIREANKLCQSLTTSIRGSSSIKGNDEDENICQERKHSLRKGKEKVAEVKNEVGKQVCGICLSEEDKRRVRGALDCCSHFFCFACIMEWSKVESRCPLCKQRFKTISKPARLNTGIDLRNVVIQIPERDQVYQPSEEELRGYLDPYENVICTECRLGGDDNLMLLCDLCDSPAHTYCVGLGQEVPEGNWYCDGCRPVALGSSSSQAQEIIADQRISSNSMSNGSVPREALDLNALPSSYVPSFQGLGTNTSPRVPVGDVQAASSGSGPGAPTLFRRRWIQSHIQNIILNRMDFLGGRTDVNRAASSANDFINPHIDLRRQTSLHHTGIQAMGMLHQTLVNTGIPLQNPELFPFRMDNFRRQEIADQNGCTIRSVGGIAWDNLGGINNSGFGQQYLGSTRSSIGSDGSLSPRMVREGSHFYDAKEQVQAMVREHLTSLSRDINLGFNMFKEIQKSSTHTVLAACGLEHRRNEVYTVPLPSVCLHMKSLVGGQMSLMKGHCPSCFELFVRDVVKTILNSRLPSWLVRC